jgi:hypothetical protein
VTRFRKKPIVIDAWQFTDAASAQRIMDVARDAGVTIAFVAGNPANPIPAHMVIPTLEGPMTALPGDWIIRGVAGEFYPCKPDIFTASYEEVPE